uniref:Zgc:162331 n=1 Tax=Oncorhynchus kisutch TaxID=8019 RepID=A0A8C7D485_ONCKI
MSRGGRPLCGWARMWPLACALTLAACSSVSPLLQETTSDPPIATETQTEVWTQPDHQTEAQTLAEFQTQPELQTEAQTQTELQTQPELQTESPTELESQAATINHTAIPRPEDRGLRVAVLASVVSGIVILAMSLSFIICCLQERTGKDRGSRRDGRIRRRDTRSSRRSECWLEREEGDWDTFPPPKIFHLSQRPDLRLAAESPVYLGGMAGFDNRGYQRSQESLLKATLPGLFRTESQIIYPHVVLQRVPTPTAPTAPTAPVYLHNMPSNSASNSGCAPTLPHHMPPYPTPQYPIHNSTPQRVPWQTQPH